MSALRTHMNPETIHNPLFCNLFLAELDGRPTAQCARVYAGTFAGVYLLKRRGRARLLCPGETSCRDSRRTRPVVCITALLAEQIAFTTNPTAFDLMVEGRLKGKVLYNAARGLAHRVIVAPEIKSYADLKGKTMAISTFGGFADKLSREILSQHSLVAMKDVADVANRYSRLALRAAALEQGASDLAGRQLFDHGSRTGIPRA